MAIPVVNLYDNDIPITKSNEPEENYKTGYISLYRSIANHWIFEDPIKLKWWLQILIEVNHCDKKVLIGDSLILCKRGQSLNSQLTWSKLLKCDRSKVRRFLELLESDGMIEVKTTTKTTILTVCKYDTYQQKRPTNEQQMNNKRTSNEHQMNTNNNDNNYNKVIGDKSPSKTSSFKNWSESDFIESIKKESDDYHADLLNAFYKHWSEKAPSGKMKFQLQKTWETAKRLATWRRNEENWKK